VEYAREGGEDAPPSVVGRGRRVGSGKSGDGEHAGIGPVDEYNGGVGSREKEDGEDVQREIGGIVEPTGDAVAEGQGHVDEELD